MLRRSDPSSSLLRTVLALVAVFVQAIVPAIHELGIGEHDAGEAAVAVAADGHEARLVQPGHSCDTCSICQAIRNAETLTLGIPPSDFAAITYSWFDPPISTDRPIVAPLGFALARGPPVCC